MNVTASRIALSWHCNLTCHLLHHNCRSSLVINFYFIWRCDIVSLSSNLSRAELSSVGFKKQKLQIMFMLGVVLTVTGYEWASWDYVATQNIWQQMFESFSTLLSLRYSIFYVIAFDCILMHFKLNSLKAHELSCLTASVKFNIFL